MSSGRLMPPKAGGGHVLHADVLVGRARHAELAALELQVILGGLEHVRGDLLRLVLTFWAAMWTATPPTGRLREPYVSSPCGEVAVSPWRTSTSSGVTPRASAAIWDQEVTWPWPCGEVPVTTSTLPEPNILTVADSHPARRSAARRAPGKGRGRRSRVR